MYTDPTNVRDHTIKIRLNDAENDLVDAWVKYTGQQKAAFLRELILEQAKLDMGLDSGLARAANEVTQLALSRA